MLISDKPIKSAVDDVLGFSSFANAVAVSLTEMTPTEGIVLSIEGAWGTGKTSAIQLIEQRVVLRELARETGKSIEDLEKDVWPSIIQAWDALIDKRKTHLIRFNPWNFTGQENLVRAFFTEVGGVISHPPDGAIGKAVRKITSYLPSMGTIVGAGGAAALGFIPAASVAATAGKALGEGVQRLFEEAAPSLESAKRELADALIKSNKRIIIVIDDLDRLTPSEMRAMFSLVKGLGDLPNILYLLSFDRRVVAKSLTNGPEPIEEEFLEKIVQVQLKLPPPWQPEIRNLFFKRLNHIICEAVPQDERRWRQCFFDSVAPYIESPRDVARFANTFQVIWPNVIGDVDLTDLIILTTLQLFEPSVYSMLFDNINELVGGGLILDDKELAARLDPVNANKPVIAKTALGHLFPILHKGWDTHSWDGTPYLKKREQRRVCTKEYYRNYFLFGRDPNRLSRSDIEGCLTAEDPKLAISAQLDRIGQKISPSGKSLVASFLDQIFELVFVRPLLSNRLVIALLDLSDDLIFRKDFEWEFFVEENLGRLESIVTLGLGPLSEDERKLRVETLSNHPRGLTMAAVSVERLVGHLGLYGGEARPKDEQYLSEEVATHAAAIILERIRSAAKDGSLLYLAQPTRLIWTWERFASAEEVHAWIAIQLDSSRSVLRLAEILPNVSYRSSADGQQELKSFKAKNYEKMLDVAEFKRRLSEVVSSDPQNVSARKIQEEFLAAEIVGLNDRF
jgi:predicted KAP-like P-loop ATPase